MTVIINGIIHFCLVKTYIHQVNSYMYIHRIF